ncbi:MAG TPA: hypothetical protein VGH46_02975 [Gaiellaceae bacterium]|jgi:hypothetical protein
MSPQHPLRRSLTGLLVLATFVLAAAGMVLRTEVVGIALLAGAALCATLAWYALGAPVRRRDIGREASVPPLDGSAVEQRLEA